MRVAVLGATGLVGREMIAVLAERRFPVDELVALASPRSAGELIEFGDDAVTVQATEADRFEGVDLVLASAGGGPSKTWLPVAVEAGAVCVDNSSAWRMDPEVPLVVPEINAAALADHKGIVANPNCSTIQMVMALEPLRRAAGLRRVVVSTYQSVSGSGKDAVHELEQQTTAILNGGEWLPQVYPHQIAFNCLPEIDAPGDDGYTREEWKMVLETRKIMGLPELGVVPTCVRVPVYFGHAESVVVELERPLDVAAARAALEAFEGVRVVDDLPEHLYPNTGLMGEHLDDVLVGRIRPDRTVPAGLAFWCVTDNIRKGAALNAVQIAERLFEVAP